MPLLQDAIAEMVRLLWGENKEVPLIAGYHKEVAGGGRLDVSSSPSDRSITGPCAAPAALESVHQLSEALQHRMSYRGVAQSSQLKS